mmetsp:Transcript_75309/g.122382  ORF Transcript_75309/g.122382 Transcript_75309/m.122382 type:complete len:117 (-) Transcript_75309:65-415(-)
MNCPATMTEMSTDMMSSSSANGAQVASVCAKVVMTQGGLTMSQGTCAGKGACKEAEAMLKLGESVAEGLGIAAEDIPKMQHCSECSGEHCNTASGLRAGAWIAILASAATFLAFHN